MLPAPKLITLGLQHVLVMYAGAVAVPLIVGRALSLSPQEVAILISADLFACGIATLIQTRRLSRRRHPLPVMMGVTFASVGPMLAMAGNADVGLLGIYGAVIAAGIFGVVVAPFVSRLLPLFPPVVTGTIILVIGVSLMRVGINWAGGGLPMLTKVIDGQSYTFANPAYGELGGLLIAFFVLLVILFLTKYGKGFVSNVAVLLGIVAGCGAGGDHGADELRQGRRGADGRHHLSVPLRPADLRRRGDRDHVPGDDRGDDRIDRHVPGPVRHDRAADR